MDQGNQPKKSARSGRLSRGRSALVAFIVAMAVLAAFARAPGVTQGATETDWLLLRVTVTTPEEVARLTSGPWDVLEAREGDDLFVLGDASTLEALLAQGFTVRVEQTVATSRAPLTYDGGYRTVAEHEAHLAAVAAAHPDLAVVLDAGDTWRKVQGRAGGHDLLVICLTHMRPGDCARSPATDKARFFVMASIHARELTPAEIAWRWIDALVAGYGVDPDITSLLDTTEVWVMPVANPDGRTIVELGGNSPLMQRKNANDSLGNCSIPYDGIDLNRNADWYWSLVGSSSAPCNQMYHGVGPASEPENLGLQALMRDLFRDQRGPALSDAAPLTTTGIMVTLHSNGNVNLTPWSMTAQLAANDAGLRAIAFRSGYYNGYTSGVGALVMYPMSGNTDDWAYGVLGIPGFTIEIGPVSGTCGGFMPAYSCLASTFWGPNRGALNYMASVARQPYALSLGPVVITAALATTRTLAGEPVTLTATLDDAALGAGSSKPAAQAIAAAEFYLDVPPWAGGVPVSMVARDGAFNSTREGVSGQVSTDITPGRHTLYVRGRDAQGNWGPAAARWLWVEQDTRGLLTGVVTSKDTCVDTLAPLPGAVITATGPGGARSVRQAGADGLFRMFLAAGAYTVTVAAPQHQTAVLAPAIATGMTTTLDIELIYQRPRVCVAPATVVTTVLPGQSTQVELSLKNASTRPVTVSVYAAAPGLRSPAVPAVAERSASDAYGYRVEALDGLDWVDTSAGTTLTLADDGELNVTLPFSMPFYGIITTSMRIADNGGALLAKTGDVATANRPLSATTGVPNYFLAPWWDDLYPSGALRWRAWGVSPNRKAAVEWNARNHYAVRTDSLTFEMVLGENGTILYQYQDVNLGNVAYSYGASATVGIRGANPAQSLTFSHGAPRLRDGMSLCFRRPGQPPCWATSVPWLALPQPRTLNPGETGTFLLSLSAPVTGTALLYRTTLLIDSAELPSIVPVPLAMLTAPLPMQAFIPVVLR